MEGEGTTVDLSLPIEEETEVFKRVACEAKDRQWKSLCDTLSRDITLTHFWQFYKQMDGCAVNTNTPDLIYTIGAVLKASMPQDHSNASFSKAIRTIGMKGKQSGKGWTEP